MKKIFLTTFLAISIAVSSFATPANKVSYVVRTNFESQFRHASNVQWSMGEDYTKATFLWMM